MKSIELGDYDTFSGLLSLFTAVIGLAYPFIFYFAGNRTDTGTLYNGKGITLV